MQKPKSAGQSGDTHSVIKPVKNFGLLCRSLSLGGLALALSACAPQDISLSAPLVQTESVDARAQQLLDKMTLQEKIRKGLIKTPIKSLNKHFNYSYIFSAPTR